MKNWLTIKYLEKSEKLKYNNYYERVQTRKIRRKWIEKENFIQQTFVCPKIQLCS